VFRYKRGYALCYQQETDAETDFKYICRLIHDKRASKDAYDAVLTKGAAALPYQVIVTTRYGEPSVDPLTTMLWRHNNPNIHSDDMETMYESKLSDFFAEQKARVLDYQQFGPNPEDAWPDDDEGAHEADHRATVRNAQGEASVQGVGEGSRSAGPGKVENAPADYDPRGAAAEHLNRLLTRYVGREIEEAGALSKPGGRPYVQVTAVRAFLDSSGNTIISIKYGSPSGLQIDDGNVKAKLQARLMKFYSQPLERADTTHGDGLVTWNLGQLAIGYGQILD